MSKDTLRDQIIEFHQAGDHPIGDKPHVPEDAQVRFRAGLIAEEFCETMEALFDVSAMPENWRDNLRALVKEAPVKVDLVEVADGMADLDYVVEGSRTAFGINGKPIADEVHRTNMAKFGPGSYKREDGKTMKPPDWKPPDIAGELKKQGWVE